MKLNVWLMAARPKTLTAAIVPIFAAAALVKSQGLELNYLTLILCLFCALCIQVATNFINDLIDFKKGADTQERLGPIRVTQRGLIPQKQLKIVTIIILLLALIGGIPLVLTGGWPILAIGIVSLFLTYSYTGGPFPLAYLGLGDLFVILFFGIIAVGGSYFLFTANYSWDALVLGLQIGLLSAVLIAVNNFRDMNQDFKANKKTLPVRFGPFFARIEIILLLAMPFLLQYYWLNSINIFGVLLPVMSAPLAFYLAIQISKNDPSPKFNNYLAQSALLHCGFGTLISVGLLIG